MTDEPNIYLNTLNRMEPNITGVDRDPAFASIAISLKRIADALERANLNGDNLANAIEGAIYRGMQK